MGDAAVHEFTLAQSLPQHQADEDAVAAGHPAVTYIRTPGVSDDLPGALTMTMRLTVLF
jgi:hypothetical protein